jgi:ABC-type glycerol-3-phosphate transport system permease component
MPLITYYLPSCETLGLGAGYGMNLADPLTQPPTALYAVASVDLWHWWGFLAVIFFAAFMGPAAAVALVISALKRSTEIVANPLALPSTPQWINFARAWTDAQLGRSLLNSTETTGFAVVMICSTCSMAAYALARRAGHGLSWISAYLLGTTTLPIQLYLFPLYFGFAHLGLIDNVFALSFVYTGGGICERLNRKFCEKNILVQTEE